MSHEDIINIKNLFQKYIEIENEQKRTMLVEEFKNKMPYNASLIESIRVTLNNLNKDGQNAFINGLFKNDILNLELLDNIQSQLENKTVQIDSIKKENFNIISFFNFEKDVTTENWEVTNGKVIMNDNSQKELIEITQNDSVFYNYMVERFFNKEIKDFLLLNTTDKKYVASEYKLPEISSSNIIKEESLCDVKDINYLVDRLIGEKEDKNIYLRRIFIDLITNQNYRVLSNGTGIINSDTNQNDYYVLDGVTIRKEVAIESFLRNYYDAIKDIVDIITDNYNIIANLIVDMLRTHEYNEEYLKNLRNNIVMVYEKSLVKKNLDAIEFGDRYKTGEDRKELNEEFESNVVILRKSLGLNNQNLAKSGYTSIFTVVSGIIIFGILFAYLLLK